MRLAGGTDARVYIWVTDGIMLFVRVNIFIGVLLVLILGVLLDN